MLNLTVEMFHHNTYNDALHVLITIKPVQMNK